MAIFKCKMCGGNLEVSEGMTVCECEYCMTKQTLPHLDDDKKANLYDRAGHFRRNNEFDKAISVYEKILDEDTADAEAYWSLVLCKYGIEYVEDPESHKRVPTVNRAQYTSVFADEDYKSAIKYADSVQKSIYEEEAHTIDEIQKGILAISEKEEPFDVFICYKETDNNGRRTPDSVLANDLYHQLTQEGYKVFFSRITLEDKLGTAYEPYIFAALNSAKVMVVLGTKPEYFNAVWVKNEWSRYLSLIKNGGKKILIPAYKDMDPYDLPEEFSHLQAQDMSKLGFMQDLIRGIRKIVAVDEPKNVVVNNFAANNASPILKRAFLALEDGEWDKADGFCEQVLNIDPECAEAYLGKLMAELQVKKQDNLGDQPKPFDSRKNYAKVIRFANEELRQKIVAYNEAIITRINDSDYNTAKSLLDTTNAVEHVQTAIDILLKIPQWRDSADILYGIVLANAKSHDISRLNIALKTIRKMPKRDDTEDIIYQIATSLENSQDIEELKYCISVLDSIPGYPKAPEKKAELRNAVSAIETKIKEELRRRQEEEANAKEEECKRKKAEQEQETKRNFVKALKNINLNASPIMYNDIDKIMAEFLADKKSISASGYKEAGYFAGKVDAICKQLSDVKSEANKVAHRKRLVFGWLTFISLLLGVAPFVGLLFLKVYDMKILMPLLSLCILMCILCFFFMVKWGDYTKNDKFNIRKIVQSSAYMNALDELKSDIDNKVLSDNEMRIIYEHQE